MPNSLQISGQVQFQAPAGSPIVSEIFNLQTSLQPTGTTFIKAIGALTNSVAQQVLTGVSNAGTVLLRNLDGTNVITFGPNSASQAGTLQPGALNIYSPSSGALYAGTVTGTAQLQIFAIAA